MSDFLLELHTEELPPKGLTGYADNLAANLSKELDAHRITYSEVAVFSTPRRIAVLVHNILTATADTIEHKKGPSTSAPEQAVRGFARSVGVAIEELITKTSDKGEYYLHTFTTQGIQTKEILVELCNTAISAMHFTRPMRWGSNSYSFIRPVHMVTTLLDDEVLQGEILGVTTGNITRGLRNEGVDITLTHASEYRAILASHGIEVDFIARKTLISNQIDALTKKEGVSIVPNEPLLNEITSIVEHPKAFIGRFDERFLDLPIEVIAQSMAEHQKYFTVLKNGKLQPNFVAVSNNAPEDMTIIIRGNEKVVRPRLADAEFFYQTDKTTTLESKVEKLRNVQFIKGIGSLYDKTQRIITLSSYIASHIGADIALTERAALLLKADLTTGMVLEFTSLQGTMGGYYATQDGEHPEVVTALQMQYHPKFAGDSIPTSLVSIATNIADKLDTICAVFLVGNAPTGSKDPFALRRLSLGLLRIIIENNLSLDIPNLLEAVLSNFDIKEQEDIAQTIHNFMIERLRGYYEEQGISTNVFNSALIHRNDAADFNQRMHALHAFMHSENAEALIDANKRIKNILKDADFPALGALTLTLDIEVALNNAVTKLSTLTDYHERMQALDGLRPLLDTFFSEVMVNDEDATKRHNRLNLLQQVIQQFSSVGDFTKLL